MNTKKLFYIICALSFLVSFSYVGAYDEIKCSTDPVFSEYSCNQCFDGGLKGEGENIGFLTDNWVNNTDMDKILYKEEQLMPELINLAGSQVVWTQIPDVQDFWEYSSELDSIYNSADEGYVLKPGKTIAWINSKLGYAFSLDKDNTQNGTNIGLLVYTLYHHNINGGMIEVDSNEHKECVLYKSGDAKGSSVPTEPKRLPDTGPKEFIVLILFALLLGFGIFQYRKRA